MFDAGSAIGHLGLDISEYTHGMLEAEAISSVFPQVVTEFLANPLLGLIEIAKKTAEAVGEAFTEIKNHALEVGRASIMTGVSTEFLSAVAPMAGGTENLAMALKFLQNTAFDSINGNKELAKTFNKLGIDVTDMAGNLKGGEELLLDLADAMKDLPDKGEQISAAMQLMSRSGAEMLPFLLKGADGIRQLAEEQKRLGAVVDAGEAATARKLARLGQMWDAAWLGIKKTISEPIFHFLGDNVDEAKAKIFAFSDAVRGGIEAAFEHLAPVMQRVGPALRAVADVLSRVFTPAWEALKPLLKSGLELWERLSILASESLAPALRLIEPILTLIAKAMTAVFQETAKLVDKLNELAGFALNPIKIGVEHTLGNALSNATAGGGGGPAPTTQPVNALTINGNLNVTGGKSLAREIADMVADRVWKLSKETWTGGGVSAFDWVQWAAGGH
jgi:hypothetical protein